MIFAFIERLRDRRARRQQAEVVFAANLAIREIKRQAIRQMLDVQRRAHATADDAVIVSTAVEIDSVDIEPS